MATKVEVKVSGNSVELTCDDIGVFATAAPLIQSAVWPGWFADSKTVSQLQYWLQDAKSQVESSGKATMKVGGRGFYKPSVHEIVKQLLKTIEVDVEFVPSTDDDTQAYFAQ